MLKWIYAQSLATGVIPAVALGLGVLALAFLLIRRSRHWWLFCAITGVLSAAAATALGWAVINAWYWWPEDLPATVIICVGFALWGLVLGMATAVLGLRRMFRGSAPMQHGQSDGDAPRVSTTSVRRRLAAVAATLAIVFGSAVQVNAYFGQFPTVGSLVHGSPALATGIPHFLQKKDIVRYRTEAAAESWVPPKAMLVAGQFRSVAIPGKASGFHARNAIVYLPPAYFTKNAPVLPVVVLVAGQPGSPADWLQAGHMGQVLDGYAQAHRGLAPVVVMPDPNGAQEANTMCMNSALGKVDTYMSVDVPNWITSTLNVDTNHKHWAIAGFSYGGTCAMQMVTRHPFVYPTFAAISSELEPALTANRAVTVERAFHGNTAAFNAVVPMTLLSERSYPEIHGWLATGAQDARYTNYAVALERAGARSEMKLERTTFPGGHSWIMVTEAMPAALAYLGTQLGLQ